MPFLINLIIGVVLSLASTLLQQAFAPKPQEQAKRTGTRGSAQFGGKVPQYFLVGTVGEAGKFEYRNSWGNDGDVPNAYNVDVYSFGDLAVSAMVGLFVGGVRVSIPTTGLVAQGYPIPDYPGHMWRKFYDGSQTTPDSYLTEKFGGDADRPWASDMIGRGVPYLIATSLWSETLFTGFPSFVGEFQGIKLYDPRKDSTAGGSGSQRWANPSTWAFSDNSAVIIYNIERGIYYSAAGATTLGKKIWGGNATAAQLPYAVWAAAMDKCDVAISLVGGGTEKQFRAGRRINLNERPADVIKDLLIGSNARISHASDGTIYILVAVPTVADGAFTDADLLATEPLGSIPFPNLDSIINGATATYREPAQAWEDKETAPYYRSDLEAEDDGRQQIEGLDLGTTFSGTQAQRVIKAVIEEGRRFKTHVVALPPEFAQFRPLQALAWTGERFGYTAKLFLITARTRDPFGNVVFGLQEIDPADHDWTPGTDEQPLNFAPVVTNRPAPQLVQGVTVEPAIDADSASQQRRGGYDVFWPTSAVTTDVDFVRIAHRLAGETNTRWVGLIPKPDLLLGKARVTQSLISGEVFEVQVIYIAGSGREIIASDWLPVTIPDVPEVTDIRVIQLGQELHNAYGIVTDPSIGGSIPAQLLAIQQQSEALAAAVMDVSATLKQRVDILRTSLGGSNAAVVRTELAIVEESRARAVAIDEVLASVGDVIADGFLKFEAVVDEDASTASITAKVKASSGSNFSSAAWILQAEADGLGGTESYFGVVGTFYVFSPDETIRTPVFSVDAAGVATMLAAKIGTITSGRLQSPNGKMVIDLTNSRISIST